MQAIEEKLNSNPNSSWKLFNGFIELINKKQAGNFRISLPNLSLKIKIPAYKDCKQIFSLYEDFFIRAMASRSKKKSGTNLIIWTIVKFAEINVLTIEQLTNEHWIFLSSLFPCFSVEKMQMRWFAVQKSVEQKYPWSEKEDQSLVSLIRNIISECENSKFNWTEIAEQFNKSSVEKQITRLGKHCRERWFNHLDPALKKGEWTAEEDIKLLESILANGRKWSIISKIMGSRNENSVKNRFFSLLHKFKKKKNVENDQDSILSILKNLKDLNPEAISNKMIKTIQRQTLIDKLKKSVESQNKFRFKIEPKNLKRPNSMTQKKKKAQIITCNNDKGDSLVERNLSSLIIDSPMVQKHIKLEDPIIYKEISRKPQKEQSSPESGKIKIEIELKNSTPESILTKKLSNTHNKTISLENIQKEQIHLNESRYAASQNFFPNNNFFPQENIFNPPNNYFNQGNFFPQNNYFPMFRPKENLMPQMPQENQMIKKNSFSSRHNDILSKDTIIIRDNLMNAVMSENYPNNFQIPYTHPNFLNNQFPFFYYQVPIIDPFNEEFLKNAGLFKNSMEINEPDLKNISQLVSSLSLTDEYLLEGQKLLSDLTFKSNSPGSFQDRLSNIIPNSGKSISSKRLLHHSPPPPESLLLRPKTCRNNLETIDEKKWKSNKNEKKILIYNCFNPDNFIKEGMEEEIIKSGKFADNKKNSSISFDRH